MQLLKFDIERGELSALLGGIGVRLGDPAIFFYEHLDVSVEDVNTRMLIRLPNIQKLSTVRC